MDKSIYDYPINISAGIFQSSSAILSTLKSSLSSCQLDLTGDIAHCEGFQVLRQVTEILVGGVDLALLLLRGLLLHDHLHQTTAGGLHLLEDQQVVFLHDGCPATVQGLQTLLQLLPGQELGQSDVPLGGHSVVGGAVAPFALHERAHLVLGLRSAGHLLSCGCSGSPLRTLK